MFRHLATIVVLTAGATQASAQSASNLFWLAGEIRSQMATVRAQADATFCGCREADDVYDELEDLCRRMDRFEERLACPIESRGDLRRLARAAERVDRQACELDEAIDHALRRSGPALGVPALDAPVVLPPRHVSARHLGYGPTFGVPGLDGPRHTVLRMNIGGLSFGVCDGGDFHVGPATRAFRHRSVTRTVGFGQPVLGADPVGHRGHQSLVRPIGWGGDAQAAALCHQMDRLRQLTAALSAALCR